MYRVGSTFEETREAADEQEYVTTTGAGFLDFIKLFYFSIVIQLFIIIALVGFMHVVVEPFV